MADKPRRSAGEGTIRPDGRYQVRHTFPDGSTRSFYGKTKQRAQQKRNDAVREWEAGARRAGERSTVADHLERWLEEVARPTVKPNVFVRYEINVRKHLAPGLGSKRLAELEPEDIQRFYSRKLASGLAPRTVRQMHMVLHNALKVAVLWRLRPWNPADAVSPPRAPKPEHTRLNAEQAIRLLSLLPGDPLDCLVTLALTTGLREAELLGLRWSDVDLPCRTVYVRRQVQRIQGVGWVESEPKSKTSRRAVALTEIGARALARQRDRVRELREAAELLGHEWDDRDLVHPNGRGRPIERQNLLRRWKRFLEIHGLPAMTIHELRHSAATLLLALKVPLKTVQEILGHSQISTTADIYGGEVVPLHQEAMAQLDALLSPPSYTSTAVEAYSEASGSPRPFLRVIEGNKKPRSP